MAAPEPASAQVRLLVQRYKEAYLVARLISRSGRPIKRAGLAAAALLAAQGAILMATARAAEAAFVLGAGAVTLGLLAGALFYFLGVLVAAQGEVLRASLDGAVGSSPFLTDEHRTSILFLPE
jgi:hypothetical protein